MHFGYARVSKAHEQDTAAQLRALQEAGAQRVFTEHASGGRWDRPELHKMLDQLRKDDVVIAWKLDRLSRSLKDLLHLGSSPATASKIRKFKCWACTCCIISLVYVNTLMMQQVLAEPEWQGRLTSVDLRALTPLKWQHINPYGTFTLNMHERLSLDT